MLLPTSLLEVNSFYMEFYGCMVFIQDSMSPEVES